MADTGERQLSLLLTGVPPVLPASGPRPADVEAAISGSQTLENAARAALGFYAKAVGLTGPPDAERSQALYESLTVALGADESDQLSLAVTSFQSALRRLAAEESSRWLAFIPLDSASDQVAQPSYAFDGASVRVCVLPPTATSVKHLQELAFQFGTPEFSLSEDLACSSVALLVRGSQVRAAERALRRFGDVRDAARAAWLVTRETPRGPSSPIDLTEKWLGVRLMAGDGSTSTLRQLRASDVRLEVDPTVIQYPPASSHYGRALRILAAPAVVAGDRNSQDSPEARLARSFRVIARSWVQASFDVRYLLYLVALESLIPAREEITEAVADIGARLLATEVTERKACAAQLRDAYNVRSRFVHDGELTMADARTKGGTPVAQLQQLVLRVWSRLVRNYLDLAERSATSTDLEAVLADFRGKTIDPYAFGSSWPDAVRGVMRDD